MQLSGNIVNFSLPELLQVMGNGQKSGVLSIQGSEGAARIFFQEGHVVHAEAGELSGEEGFYRLFRFREGEFTFTGGAVAPCQTIFVDNTTLMLEAARLTDEDGTRAGTGEERALAFPVGGELGEFGELHLSEPGYETFTGWDAPPLDELVGTEVALHPRMLDAAERLSARLESFGDGGGYVVWSRDGLLKSGDGDSAAPLFQSLDAPSLSDLLDAAALAGEALHAGKLLCGVAAARTGERAALFCLAGLVACVRLEKGARPLEFLEKVRQVEAVPDAASGVNK